MKKRIKFLLSRSFVVELIALAIATLAGIVWSGCAPELSFGPGTREAPSGVPNTLSGPRFDFFIMNYPSEDSDSSNGDIYARVRYDNLIFVRRDSGFAAHYQLSINVYSDRELTDDLYSKTFDRQISVPSYVQPVFGSTSTMYDTLKDGLTMKPGRYFILLRLYDLNTNSTLSREIEYTFKDFLRDRVNISDIFLYNQSDTSGVPVYVTTDRRDSLFAQFYITSKSVPERILLHVIAKSVESSTFIDTTYELSQTSNVQRYRLPIPLASLAPAVYDLRAILGGKDHENSSETTFRIPRGLTPFLPAELDQETAPLVYIASPGSVDSLRKGTFEERRKNIARFWSTRANGDTAVAGAMQKEFYKRVDFANEHFGTGMTEGWRTDRGRIYILYGSPDQIENHDKRLSADSFRNSPSYQVWYYYKLKLRLVFVDEFGTGDYRLTAPRQGSGSI